MHACVVAAQRTWRPALEREESLCCLRTVKERERERPSKQRQAQDSRYLHLLSQAASNALILPCKRKNKAQEKTNNGKKNRQDLRISNSKLKKLQKLEDEKQKKLLQARSFEILRNHKISFDGYSLLHASGTIGQTETLKEKLRRAAQFSRAGLVVPEELTLFKKDGQRRYFENSEASEEVFPHKFVDPTDTNECNRNLTGGKSYSGIKDDAMEPVECELLVDVQMSNPEPATEGTFDMLADSRITPTVPSCSCEEIDLQDEELIPEETAVEDCFNQPLVVPVSRPYEVEKAREDLPIIRMEQEIMEAIYENSVVILCGETGCGKTTQVPQFLYEAGFGTSNRVDRKGIIGITQPRRVAVLATARRVSYELGLENVVGFQVRHDKMVGSNCSIKFMTDGILLREIQRYSVIILDEAHERSLNTDILIGMLSRVAKHRKNLHAEGIKKLRLGLIDPEDVINQLKVVLMSATLQLEDFISNRRLFDVIPPAVEVPARQFRITIHFSKRTHDDYLAHAYKRVMSIHKRLPRGGILVFVTGQQEVNYLCKKLQQASKQLTDKKPEKVGGDEGSSIPKVDKKEIYEAYDDMFSSDEEDELNAGSNVDSSDIETDGDLDTDSDTDSEDEFSYTCETKEEDDLVLEFLKGAEGSSVLKASCSAISRNVEESNDDMSLEESIPSAPCFSKCTKSMSVSHGKLRVLPLYSMLPASQQLLVFQDTPEDERLVVVATNVAETSLTIPGIKYVVDTGKQKVKSYNHATGMTSYDIQWISKASAFQRAGRAGRTGPGHCYRLYSAAAYGKDELFPQFSEPEIKKNPLDGVLLMLKFMEIDVLKFPFPTPPDKESLVEAERSLKVLGALDSQGEPTPLGKAMAQYPMSPRHSRLLLTIIKILKSQQGFARPNFILGFASAAASALSFPSPFLMQNEFSGASKDHNQDSDDEDQQERKKQKKKLKAMVRDSRAQFINPSSDALTVAHALWLFELSENTVEFCRVNSLHLKTMEEMSKLRKQLLRLIFHQSQSCEEFSWKFGGLGVVEEAWRSETAKKPMQSHEEEILMEGICAGWADRAAKRIHTFSASSRDARKVRAVRYQSCALSDTIYLHRASSVAQIAPDFVVYSELVNKNRPYMHGVTKVKPSWLLKYASSLCTFSAPLEDQERYHYYPNKDQVCCSVRLTFSRHNWQLLLHELPVSDGSIRSQVFASALLKGNVLPCLKGAREFLSLPPSVFVGPVIHRKVGDLLKRMKNGINTIDSRAALRDAWDRWPGFLYPEIKACFQDKFHSQFGALWNKMQQEIQDLSPKGCRKA
ncbi:hypothetical protein U9M48_011558 [Paspalum notatum var. saurae]|uniref:RNA helicase n=1 Tax=Paspalum notatum var. saurae TaxID=547442 RepID=A0AAQ3SVZ2_PASNO